MLFRSGETNHKPASSVQPTSSATSATSNGTKFNFSNFVPVTTSTTQKKDQAKASTQSSLMSFFGNHSDEEEDESEKKKDTTIKVNRRTNIHYAVHRTGEKYTTRFLFLLISLEVNLIVFTKNLYERRSEPPSKLYLMVKVKADLHSVFILFYLLTLPTPVHHLRQIL